MAMINKGALAVLLSAAVLLSPAHARLGALAASEAPPAAVTAAAEAVAAAAGRELVMSGRDVPEDATDLFFTGSLRMASDVLPHQPWMCGCMLIDESWILTAAHCVTNPDPRRRPVKVIFGQTEQQTPVNSVPTEEHKFATGLDMDHVYPFKDVSNDNVAFDFDDNKLKWDVALVKLKNPVPRRIKPVALAAPGNDFEQPGTMLRVAGWGRTEASIFRPYSGKMQVTDVPYVSHKQCSSVRAFRDLHEPSQICAGYPFGTPAQPSPDACGGDSGGPLFVDTGKHKVALGVVSFGHGCGTTYGVYSRISSPRVKTFVDETLRREGKTSATWVSS